MLLDILDQLGEDGLKLLEGRRHSGDGGAWGFHAREGDGSVEIQSCTVRQWKPVNAAVQTAGANGGQRVGQE